MSRRKTCPERWKDQKQYNLFLRYKDEQLLKTLAKATETPESEATPLELFTMLRKLKDKFSTKSKSRRNSSSSRSPANSSIAAIVAKIQQERAISEGEPNTNGNCSRRHSRQNVHLTPRVKNSSSSCSHSESCSHANVSENVSPEKSSLATEGADSLS